MDEIMDIIKNENSIKNDIKDRPLITGGTGLLGKEFYKIMPYAIAPTREQLDLTVPRAIDNYLYMLDNYRLGLPISTIIHCGAMTSVRECEEKRESAFKTNVKGTANLFNSFMKNSSHPDPLFVYISTACVFPGDGYSSYDENDLPYPKNFYSLMKYQAELSLMSSQYYPSNVLIVRTNFVGRGKWPYKKAFTDRYGTYLYADQVANEISALIMNGVRGLVHVHGEDEVSMFEVAKMTDPGVKKMTIEDYSGPPLTMNMSLDSIRHSPVKMK